MALHILFQFGERAFYTITVPSFCLQLQILPKCLCFQGTCDKHMIWKKQKLKTVIYIKPKMQLSVEKQNNNILVLWQDNEVAARQESLENRGTSKCRGSSSRRPSLQLPVRYSDDRGHLVENILIMTQYKCMLILILQNLVETKGMFYDQTVIDDTENILIQK